MFEKPTGGAPVLGVTIDRYETIIQLPSDPDTIAAHIRAMSRLEDIDPNKIQGVRWLMPEPHPAVRGTLETHPTTLDELNYLAHLVGDMERDQQIALALASIYDEAHRPESVEQLINMCGNVDRYRCLTGVHSKHKLGEWALAHDMSDFSFQINKIMSGDRTRDKAFSEYLQTLNLCADPKKYGDATDLRLHGFFTNYGYLYRDPELAREPWTQIYSGERVPEQYRIDTSPLRQRVPWSERPGRRQEDREPDRTM